MKHDITPAMVRRAVRRAVAEGVRAHADWEARYTALNDWATREARMAREAAAQAAAWREGDQRRIARLEATIEAVKEDLVDARRSASRMVEDLNDALGDPAAAWTGAGYDWPTLLRITRQQRGES